MEAASAPVFSNYLYALHLLLHAPCGIPSVELYGMPAGAGPAGRKPVSQLPAGRAHHAGSQLHAGVAAAPAPQPPAPHVECLGHGCRAVPAAAARVCPRQNPPMSWACAAFCGSITSTCISEPLTGECALPGILHLQAILRDVHAARAGLPAFAVPQSRLIELRMCSLLANEGQVEFQPSPFFAQQLTAFELWLQHGSRDRKPPEQLPIVLQVQAVAQLHLW